MKKNKVLIVGAGLQSRAIAYDILTRSGTNNISELFIVDVNEQSLSTTRDFLSNLESKTSFTTYLTDGNPESLLELFRLTDIVVGCSSYKHNEVLTRYSIENGCHFVDLGGNNTVVANQKKMSKSAELQGVSVIPDCGLAPGMVNIISSYYAKSNPKRLNVYVGGIPQKPANTLGYDLVFSVTGLVNEYIEDCYIKEDGQVIVTESLTGQQSISPFGKYKKLEAFRTSGGISQMTEYLSNVDNMEYKTIRYTGHRDKILLMKELGLFSPDNRKEIEEKLETLLKPSGEDVVLARIEETTSEGKIVLHDLVIEPRFGLTAMQVATGFSAASIIEMLAKDEITKRGTLSQEVDIPQVEYINQLSERDIEFT